MEKTVTDAAVTQLTYGACTGLILAYTYYQLQLRSYNHSIRYPSVYPLPSILFNFHYRYRLHYGHYNYPDSFCLYRC